MLYFRFSLVFVVIFFGAMLYNFQIAEGSLVGLGVLSIFMLLGTMAILIFFSRNKRLIAQYANSPDVELLKKLIVGSHNRKEGEKADTWFVDFESGLIAGAGDGRGWWGKSVVVNYLSAEFWGGLLHSRCRWGRVVGMLEFFINFISSVLVFFFVHFVVKVVARFFQWQHGVTFPILLLILMVSTLLGSSVAKLVLVSLE